MYKINFSAYLKILSWDIIYWGIKNELIEESSAIDYANKLIETNSNNVDSLVIDLFIPASLTKDAVLSLISDYIPQSDEKKTKSIKILRYIILDNVKQTNKSIGEVLNSIERVYIDFDYPTDMSSLIRYMPIEDDDYNPSNHTPEENEQRLFEKFTLFLEEQKKQIMHAT